MSSQLDKKKLLLLLGALVVLVNYINYFKPDSKRLYRQLHLLEAKINIEKELSKLQIEPRELKLPQMELFFDKNISYSQAMGRLQKIIQSSARGICDMGRVSWAQLPLSNQYYDYLKISFTIKCEAKNIFKFANRLKSHKKIILFENFRVTRGTRRDKQKRQIVLSAQTVAFRIKDAL